VESHESGLQTDCVNQLHICTAESACIFDKRSFLHQYIPTGFTNWLSIGSAAALLLLLLLPFMLLLPDCSPGYFVSGKSQNCRPCTRGKYCPAGKLSGIAMDCPAGLATITDAAVSVVQVG
jgi:hypothetical protein